MAKKIDAYALGMLLLVALYSSRVFFQPVFFPTHDLEYHIIRLWQFVINISDQVLIPRWAPDLNYGYGVPLFSFFYPLPNYIGSTFHALGYSLIDSVYMAVWLGFFLSAFSFYWFARMFFSPRASLTASVFYLLAPYHLLDVYVRGSIGEVWVLAFAPLVFGFSTRIVLRKQPIPSIILLSITSSLILLSHTVIGLTFLAGSFIHVYVFAYMKKVLNPRVVFQVLSGFVLGMLLVSYFYLPIVFESQYIRGLSIMEVYEHFPKWYQLIIPSWGTGFSVPGDGDTISFQVGIPHIIVSILALVIAVYKRDKYILIWIASAILIVFLLLEWSIPIWRLVSIMNYYQFPWRLLSVLVFITSFFAGYVTEHIRIRYAFILIFLAVLFYHSYTYPVTYQKRDDSFYLSNPDWTTGTATLGNSFNTAWFNGPRKDLTNQNVRIYQEMSNSVTRQYTLSSDEDMIFYPQIAYYPGWNAWVNGRETTVLNENGVAGVKISAGDHTIMLKLEKTWIQKVGSIISLASLIGGVSIIIYLYARRH